jgi:NAD(P)-dependent dehydrogenase (short-subunit alcohol dehydrogenase family)
LSGRPVALVTGGRRGIGRAIALALAQAGHDIAISDLVEDAETGRTVQVLEDAGARVFAATSDAADLASHARLLDGVERALGPVDVFVSNAGIGSPVRGDMLALAPESFDITLGVNLRGAAFLSQAVAQRMLARESATPRAIIFITSVSAAMVSPERPDYCISKAGLSMWAQALAVRLAPHAIPVFEVRPGIIRTAMTAGVAERYDGLIADGLVPARRWGEPEDVARVVAALATGSFAFASGSIINADGGLAIQRL